MLRLALGRCIFLVLVLAVASQASMIGNPVIQRDLFDTCNGCSFALSTPFPVAGEAVVTWSFWADATGLAITPLLYDWNGSNFVITAIGTTQVPTALGAQTYDFGLVSGSAVVGANTYFGYRDGTVDAGNTGTIAFNDSTSGTFMYYFGDGAGGPNPNPFVGEVMTLGSVQGGELQRNYSIEADTSSVPEPSAWLLSIAGLGVLAGIRFKR